MTYAFLGCLVFLLSCIGLPRADAGTSLFFDRAYDITTPDADTLGTIYMLEDAQRSMTAGNVLALVKARDPRIVLQTKNNLALKASAFWFMIELSSQDAQAQTILMRNKSAVTDYFDIYIYDEDLNLLHHELSGDHRPIDVRRIHSSEPTVEFVLGPGKKVLALFRVETAGTLIFQLEVKRLEHYLNDRARELAFLGVYFGLVAMMIVYHCFMFGKLREWVNLSYAAYLLFFGLFQSTLSGFSYEFVWGSAPWFSAYAIPVGASLGLYFATDFSISYLRLSTYSSLAFYFGRFLQASALAGVLLMFFIPYEKTMAYISALAIVIFCFYLTVGYQGCRKGLRPAYYFMAAWSLFSVCIIVLALRNFGVVPNHFLIVYGSYVGSAFEIVLLSLGVSDRIQEERRARLEAKEEALAISEKAKQDLERRNQAFERFVPHDLVDMLGKSDIEEIELGQQREKQLTFMFCDIRSYTKISETMTPSQNFAFLQSYYELIAPVIRRHGGHIDKYIGDAILAVFDEIPDTALAAALEIFEKLEEFNQHNTWTKEPLRIGIGVHSGSAVLGVIGERSRLEGTVIGDAVNLAARLEKLTKQRGAPLLTSRETIAKLRDPRSIQCRAIGRSRVDGKTQEVHLVEILNHEPEAIRLAKLQHKDIFAELITLWDAGDRVSLRQALVSYLKKVPSDGVALYLQREIEAEDILRQAS